jgi:GNAT superfamily N-acetyltransferase
LRSESKFQVTLEITIRRSKETDLCALEWDGIYREHRQLIQEAYERQRSGEVVMLQADLNGFPVGQLWLDLERKKNESAGILWALRVFAILQNHGIGRRLLAAGERELSARGFSWAEISVDEKEPRAASLYLRLGYKPTVRVHEEYSYRSPSGALVHVPVALQLFRKRLGVDMPPPGV